MKKPIVILLTALTITASSAAMASADTNYTPNYRPQAVNATQSNQHKVEQLVAQLKGLRNQPQSSKETKQLEAQIESLIDQDYNYSSSIRNDIDALRNEGHFSNWQPKVNWNQNIAQSNQYRVGQLVAQLKNLVNQQPTWQIQEQVRQLEAQIESLIDQDNYNNYSLSIRNDIDALRNRGHFSNWSPKSNDHNSHQNEHRQDGHGQNGHEQNDNK